MPASGFNVGRDVTLTIFSSAGVISTAALKMFDSKPLTAEVKQLLITGNMLPAYLPEGWEGSFTFARVDSSLDDYFAKVEDGYYAGQDLPSGTITETIENVDGTISQYAYSPIALKLDDAGSWSGNKEVDQKVSFLAGRRRKII